MRVPVLPLLGLLGCSTITDVGPGHGTWRATGRIEFEVYDAPVCGDAGPSAIGRCSRAAYSGGLEGSGDTSIQSMVPVAPDGVLSITENEVLRLREGILTTRINAVYHTTSPDREVISLRTITGGTGRYAGASGYIRLWGHADSAAGYEYVAVIRFLK